MPKLTPLPPSAAHNNFADALSALICHHVHQGVALDEALCIAAAVIADYARGQLSLAYLDVIADIVVARAACPLPRLRGEAH